MNEIIRKMPDKLYHSKIEYISKSGLDVISKSPLHYYTKYLSPEKIEEAPTPAKIIGAAFHCFVFEPGSFDERYCITPKINKRSKAGKEEFYAFVENNEGKQMVKEEDFETIKEMDKSLKAHPRVASLLKMNEGEAESAFFFENLNEGVKCRVKTDFINVNRGIILDLKTTEDASPAGFQRSAYKYRYHVQSAYYLDGLKNFDDYSHTKSFVFLAIEKEPPYAVAVYLASKDFVNAGREAYLEDLKKYKEALKTNVWEGYSNDAMILDLPKYAYK